MEQSVYLVNWRRSHYTEEWLGRLGSGYSFGAWLSLVERLVRDQEVRSSNLRAPTIFQRNLNSSSAVLRSSFSLDEIKHFSHNLDASVATLGIIPERGSVSFCNQLRWNPQAKGMGPLSDQLCI